MAKIIAVTNQKGGVAKTTTTLNVGAGLARRGHRVLAIDADPQANLSTVLVGGDMALGPRQLGVKLIGELLLGKAEIDEVIYRVELEPSSSAVYQKDFGGTIDVLPSHLSLARVLEQLRAKMQRELILKKQLDQISDHYDFIVIDCPPSLDILTVNALTASDGAWVPVSPGVFPSVGLGLLMETLQEVRQINPKLSVDGIIPVMLESLKEKSQPIITRETLSDLVENFGSLVVAGIPQRVAVSEAIAAGQDIFAYAPKAEVTKAFWKLVGTVEAKYG